MDMTIADPALARLSLDEPRPRTRSIGEILIADGALNADAAARVARAQAEHGLPFGEAAVLLGLATTRDVEVALARQFDYPYLEPANGAVAGGVISALRPFGAFAEQMRVLRTRLELHRATQPTLPATLAIVSAVSGEGRSFTAANLAVAYAQMGRRTLLIDADLRHPQQHLMFNRPERMGLSNILLGRAGLECAAKVAGLAGLSVLGAGTVPPNPQELLTRPRFASLLHEAADAYDIVILDTPPASTCADAQIVASLAGMSVLVARARLSDSKRLTQVVSSLRQGGARLAGSVFNDA
jgi:protein-tyrosine kinase